MPKYQQYSKKKKSRKSIEKQGKGENRLPQNKKKSKTKFEKHKESKYQSLYQFLLQKIKNATLNVK